MQEPIDTINKWCQKWEQRINPAKSTTALITRKRIQAGDPLKLDNTEILFQSTVKILGIIFDAPHLTWRTHIENLIIKCHKRLNLMRCLAGVRNGITRELLNLYYQAHIKSIINYGLPIYSSSAPTNLNRLAVLHNTAARLITGAWKSTPLHALYCEARIIPSDIQVAIACANFIIRLLTGPADHPILELFSKDNWLDLIPLSSKKYKTPLIYRVKNNDKLKDIRQKLPLLKTLDKPSFPPWVDLTKLSNPTPIDPEFTKNPVTAPNIFKNLVSQQFADATLIFTDGSLLQSQDETNEVGASMFIPSKDLKYRWKLDEHHTILSAEMFALQKATAYAANKMNPSAIFTDSQAALSLLSSNKPKSYRNSVNIIQQNLKKGNAQTILH